MANNVTVTPAAAKMVYASGSTDFITVSGNVSGSSNPSYGVGGLHVTSDQTNSFGLFIHNKKAGGGNQYAKVELASEDDNLMVYHTWDNSAGGLGAQRFTQTVGETRAIFEGRSASNQLVLISGGNIGMGTNAPGERLHVAGTSRVTGKAAFGGSTLPTNTGISVVDTVQIQEKGSAPTATTAYGTFWVSGSTPNKPMFLDDAGTAFDLSAATGPIDFPSNSAATFDNTNNNNQYFISNRGSNAATLGFGIGNVDNANVKVTFDGDGDVGIGTSSPSEKLDVRGKILIDQYLRLQRNTSTNGLNLTDSGGNAVPAHAKALFAGDGYNIQPNVSELLLYKSTTGSTSATAGKIRFASRNDAATSMDFAQIEGIANDDTASAEDGDIVFRVEHNSTMTELMRLNGHDSVTRFGNSSATKNHLIVERDPSDTTYNILHGKAKYPRIRLEDTQASATQDIWHLGNQMRFGTNAGSSTTAAMYIQNGQPSDGGNYAAVYLNARAIVGAELGVGTSSPAQPLHVLTSANDKGILIDVSDDSHEGRLLFGDTSSNAIGHIGYNHSLNAMRFFTNGSEALRLESDQDANFYGNITTDSLGLGLRFDGRDDLLIRGTASFDMEITAPQDVAFGIDSDNNETTHAFLWKTNSKTPSSAGTELMRLNEAGNLGIGTTSPSRKLHVVEGSNGYAARFEDGIELDGTNVQLLGYGQGNLWVMGNSGNPKLTLGYSHNWDFAVSLQYIRGATGGSSYVGDGELKIGQLNKNNANWDHGITSFYVSGSERMRIFKDGNVGIGTTAAGATPNAPVARLHVADTASADVGIALTNSDTGHGANDGFQFYIDTSKNAYLINREASDMKFYTSNAQKMVIKSDGKVGIGTTSPSYELTLADKFMWDGNHWRANQTNGASMRNEVPSSTNPVFTFNNDVDTGIGRASADVLSLIAGGTEHVRVDNGNGTVKFYNDISFDASKGIVNDVASVTEWLPDQAGSSLEGTITMYSKIQLIRTDSPPINWGGLNSAKLVLPAATAGREHIINWSSNQSNLSGKTFSLNPAGSDALYKAGVSGPVGINKNTGESIHVICAEAGVWSVVAHT